MRGAVEERWGLGGGFRRGCRAGGRAVEGGGGGSVLGGPTPQEMHFLHQTIENDYRS